MTIEQTVEIPDNHHLHLELNLPETAVARGKAKVIVHFPVQEENQAVEKAGHSVEWERTLAVLKRTQGAWKDNPWENYMEDLQAMRKEWERRDPWNHESASQE
jgi:hypothetical protein